MPNIRHAQKIFKPSLHRIALISGVSLAFIAAPLATAPAVQATQTKAGCSATALRPIYVRTNPAGKKVIDYRIRVTCDANRRIIIGQRFWEDDSALRGGNDRIAKDEVHRPYFSTKRTIILHAYRVLVDTERGEEEVFHDFKFRVRSNGVTSPQSGLEKSPNLTIYD